MDIVSYQDYQKHKPKIIEGMSNLDCALFNAVSSLYLYEKYQSQLRQDLNNEEVTILNEVVNKLWGDEFNKPDIREGANELFSKLEKIGLDEDGGSLDLTPETICVLSSFSYSLSQSYGSFDQTINHVLETLTDCVDRELDEKYPDYVNGSLRKMFTYKESKQVLINIFDLVEQIRKGNHSRALVNTLKKTC